eukprot:3249183-Prymnesium_polylepis.1
MTSDAAGAAPDSQRARSAVRPAAEGTAAAATAAMLALRRGSAVKERPPPAPRVQLCTTSARKRLRTPSIRRARRSACRHSLLAKQASPLQLLQRKSRLRTAPRSTQHGSAKAARGRE